MAGLDNAGPDGPESKLRPSASTRTGAACRLPGTWGGTSASMAELVSTDADTGSGSSSSVPRPARVVALVLIEESFDSGSAVFVEGLVTSTAALADAKESATATAGP